MYKAVRWISLLVPILCSTFLHAAANRFSDAPEHRPGPKEPFKSAEAYGEALKIWKTAEDINAWIAACFTYDAARAKRLSETQRRKEGGLPIYAPSALFENKAGVCIDLARFGFETLKSIDPQSDPKYLMIEFDPAQIEGNTLRLHWLVSFGREGEFYFFADSKRPGYIAGPFRDTQTFIDEYENYRGRRIVDFRESDSYEKQRRTRARREQRQEP